MDLAFGVADGDPGAVTFAAAGIFLGKLKGLKVLQTGGQTITRQTADALNKFAGSRLARRDVGRALEALKREVGLPNNLRGSKILENGDLLDYAGQVLGNIIDYFP